MCICPWYLAHLESIYFKPKGLFTKVGASQITDGIPVGAHPVYIPEAKKPIDFVFEGFRTGFVRNKVCGTVLG